LSDWPKFAAVVAQLAVLSLLAVAFQVETQAFRYVLALSAAGFVIHHLLPLRFRMAFFALLSIVGLIVAFGVEGAWAESAWLLGLGGLLIGLAHMPIPFLGRIALIVVGTGGLMAMRVGYFPAPWSGLLWPAFGAMFMFRGMIYLYDLRTNAAPFSLSRAVAYFFMLPTVCFPLFPVIDYKAFQRSHFNDDATRIYQKGIVWMFRGMVQLLMYRLLYRNAPLDPDTVVDAGSAALFMVSTYLLYLKVSGSFHVIVGLLHLFGFNLAETHHRYLLSSSFTDFWRRINIYWKDFIQKLFFYPVFFRVRKLGETPALVIATVIAFAATWFLHGYQMFWLLGRLPLVITDSLFWAILAVLVLVNVLWETKRKKRRRVKEADWTWRAELGRMARTVGVFVTITLLWALWTAESVEQWLAEMAAFADLSLEGVLVIAGTLSCVAVGSVWLGRTSSDRAGVSSTSPTGGESGFWRSACQTSLLAGALLLAGWQPKLLDFAPALRDEVAQLRSSQLSSRDGALLARGYYEDLTNEVRFNPELWGSYAQRPLDWKEITESDAVSRSDNFFEFELIPNLRTRHKGMRFSTNRWGIRDRDYPKAKPPATYRIALIGASRAMGSGVSDDETFEVLIEDRLNEELGARTGLRYEILNFSMGNFGPLKKLRAFESKAVDFDPDAILYVGHVSEASFVLEDVTRAVVHDLEIPYPEIEAIAREARVEEAPSARAVRVKLRPYAERMSDFAWRRLIAACRERGMAAYMTLLPATLAAPPSANERTAQAAAMEERGFTFLDLSDVFQVDRPARDLVVAPWDGHPNAAGHRLIANALYDKLFLYLSTVAE